MEKRQAGIEGLVQRRQMDEAQQSVRTGVVIGSSKSAERVPQRRQARIRQALGHMAEPAEPRRVTHPAAKLAERETIVEGGRDQPIRETGNSARRDKPHRGRPLIGRSAAVIDAFAPSQTIKG